MTQVTVLGGGQLGLDARPGRASRSACAFTFLDPRRGAPRPHGRRPGRRRRSTTSSPPSTAAEGARRRHLRVGRRARRHRPRTSRRSHRCSRPRALEVAQDRLAEKETCSDLGDPDRARSTRSTRAPISTRAVGALGLPGGAEDPARRLRRQGPGGAARGRPTSTRRGPQLGGVPLILEGFVPFDRELSIVARARPRRRDRAAGPSSRTSTATASCASPARRRAGTTTRCRPRPRRASGRCSTRSTTSASAASSCSTSTATLLANEIAPRVHNSGHWTIEGAETSQFENHLRAVLGLAARIDRAHAARARWSTASARCPTATPCSRVPGAHLHDYGKEPRPGRKLGHVTVTAPDPAELRGAPRRASLAAVVDAC